jgi:hypothetical protein
MVGASSETISVKHMIHENIACPECEAESVDMIRNTRAGSLFPSGLGRSVAWEMKTAAME